MVNDECANALMVNGLIRNSESRIL